MSPSSEADAAPVTDPSRPGSYTHLRRIASGGMGTVDLVVHRKGRFRRLLARKRLHSGLQDDPAVRAMFLDEARLAGLLRHPNAVSVVDVGIDDTGPYLLMDFVEGITATELIRWARHREAELPLSVVVELVMQAALGLHAAHELRDAHGEALHLVHRDVSPQNLLVGFDGTVRVTDFGIAKAVGQSTKTATGVVKGKAGYLPPEVLRFEPIDRRSDLFSLGVVLFELCTQSRLYGSGGSKPAGYRILHEAAPDLALFRDDIPSDLVRLSLSLLAKSPGDRPENALLVADALREIGDGISLVSDEAPDLITFMRREFESAAEKLRSDLARLNQETTESLEETETRVATRLSTWKLRLWVVLSAAAALALIARFTWSATGDALPSPGATATAGRPGAEITASGAVRSNSDVIPDETEQSPPGSAEPHPSTEEDPAATQMATDPAPQSLDDPMRIRRERSTRSVRRRRQVEPITPAIPDSRSERRGDQQATPASPTRPPGATIRDDLRDRMGIDPW